MPNPTFRLKGSAYPFTPLEGPIDRAPHAKLIAEIGHAMLAFSRLEYMVTTLVLQVNKQAASQTLHDPDPVAKFGALVKLLRRWLTKHPAYTHLTSADDDRFYEALLQDAVLRNELAHGFLESIDHNTGSFTMRHIKRDGRDLWSATTRTYAAKTPTYLGSQATLATRHFVEIAKVIFEKDTGDDG